MSKPIVDTERLHVVLTIGHPARTLAEFIRLLKAHDVSCVVDVRTVPRSRHNPQFNKTSLRGVEEGWLELFSRAGIGRIASCEA